MIPLLNRGGMMKGFVRGADRQQTTLLPECLDDWVDESNLALFGVAYQIIGTGYHLKLLFGFRIARIQVGMQLFCQLAISFLNIVC
jgi:hypothetical protein